MKLKQFLKFLPYFLFYAGMALGAFIVLTNIVVHVESSAYIYKNAKDVPEAQVAIILGAGVYTNGKLSPVFQNRVDKAIELYQAKKVSKILASGDNSTVEHNEVNPVRNYLLGKGIPDSDIYLDHAGFDTYSTMYRARDIFQVSSVIVVTQSFHLPRSIFIARMLGIQAYGIPADDGETPAENYLREIFANEKAVLNLLLERQPKFLGEVIPIN